MNIALIGYGKMGREIEKIALKRGHSISLKIDIANMAELTVANLKDTDVAIEFTSPESAYRNYLLCFGAGVPVVSGTTGWQSKLQEIETICKKDKNGFFWASNFSLGVNLFFLINNKIAEIMNKFPEYDIAIEDIHHNNKLDAPSGTAITLAEGILKEINRKKDWVLNEFKSVQSLQIVAKRIGEVPGTHIVTYDSEVDSIEITHTAKGRRGFALGAVLAAEFMKGKTGVYGMKDLLNL
ncbi:MAG: 4-hydroxy-tetrahydrodipicolinate reductase [Bacteroidales bacterium]|nr:4-hydroxy-tetrahydrodipicolinate reductase [Bacteroidales bacterium]